MLSKLGVRVKKKKSPKRRAIRPRSGLSPHGSWSLEKVEGIKYQDVSQDTSDSRLVTHLTNSFWKSSRIQFRTFGSIVMTRGRPRRRLKEEEPLSIESWSSTVIWNSFRNTSRNSRFLNYNLEDGFLLEDRFLVCNKRPVRARVLTDTRGRRWRSG